MHLFLFSQDDEQNSSRSARLWWGIGALLLVALIGLLLARTVFFVDETQYVYVTQFGEPVRLHTDPGLQVKWPYQSVRRFDRRMHIYEPPGREMLTEDKKNLTFQWFVCWRIPGESFVLQEAGAAGEPKPTDAQVRERIQQYVQRYLQAIGTVQAAESRLEERIQAAIASTIGRTRLEQLVSLDPQNVQLEQITADVTATIRRDAAAQFGIEVLDVRLKRFNYPEAVKEAVYAEIRSEREQEARQYRAEGASEKARIESLADLHRDQLVAQAQREAASIRSAGEARAMEIFNTAHRKNPEFYQLMQTLETYRKILDDQTTVVLSADSPLLKLLTRGLPEPEDVPATPSSGDKPDTAPPATVGGLNSGDPHRERP